LIHRPEEEARDRHDQIRHAGRIRERPRPLDFSRSGEDDREVMAAGILLGASLLAIPRADGYWVLLLSLGVVVIGTILVWVSARADVAKADAPVS
jgi:hypothetical protein